MRTLRLSWFAGCLGVLVCALAASAQTGSFLLRNATIHPISSPKMEQSSILVVNGVIAAVGKNLSAPKGVPLIEGRGLHVFPGMIDSATDTGLSEISAVGVTVDTGELGEFNPQIRAAVAVNPASEHFPVVRANGTTTMLLLPGGASTGGGFTPANQKPKIIQGQASLIHTDGWTWEEMEVLRGAAVQLRWPRVNVPSGRFAALSAGPRVTFAEAKKQQEGVIREIHAFIESARRYKVAFDAKDATLKPDLKLEAMIPVLTGSRPLVVFANTGRYIREAVEFAKKEKLRIVIAGADDFGDTLPLLKESNVPVILGPTYSLPSKRDLPYDYQATLPGIVFQAGVKFCFGSFGTQFARNLPYDVGNAVAYGLPHEEALKGITLYPAQIWGISEKLGSIEKGKIADLVVTDHEDPLELTTAVKYLFVGGQKADLESKHTKLYERYLNRPKPAAR